MGVAILQAAPDAAINDRLAPPLEPARSAAQPFGGVPFAWAPTRLVESACSADGRTAVLTFESTVGPARTFATIGFPGPEDLLSPGAMVVIGGSDATSPIASFDSADCGSVPTGATACTPFDTVDGRHDDRNDRLPPQSSWDALATGPSQSGARSVREAAAVAEIVLVGRWIGTEPGGPIGPSGGPTGRYAIAVIRVERLISGSLPEGCVDLVRVPFLLSFGGAAGPVRVQELAEVERMRPVEPALLFLHSWAGAWDRAGGELPAWVAPLDRADLFRTIGLDGALPITGDHVSEVTFEFDMARWRLALAGIKVDDIVAEVVADPSPWRSVGGVAGTVCSIVIALAHPSLRRI